jgi:hypothetical protein
MLLGNIAKLMKVNYYSSISYATGKTNEEMTTLDSLCDRAPTLLKGCTMQQALATKLVGPIELHLKMCHKQSLTSS